MGLLIGLIVDDGAWIASDTKQDSGFYTPESSHFHVANVNGENIGVGLIGGNKNLNTIRKINVIQNINAYVEETFSLLDNSEHYNSLIVTREHLFLVVDGVAVQLKNKYWAIGEGASVALGYLSAEIKSPYDRIQGALKTASKYSNSGTDFVIERI